MMTPQSGWDADGGGGGGADGGPGPGVGNSHKGIGPGGSSKGQYRRKGSVGSAPVSFAGVPAGDSFDAQKSRASSRRASADSLAPTRPSSRRVSMSFSAAAIEYNKGKIMTRFEVCGPALPPVPPSSWGGAGQSPN